MLSAACGVLPHSIRTWEKRYQVFTPEKNDSGQRVYSEEDLKKAKLISVLLNEGFAISKLARLTNAELEGLIELNPAPKLRSNHTENKSIAKLFQFIARYEIDDIINEMQHLRLKCGAKKFVFSVILPVMQEIGLKVASGSYSVTQEHIISTIVRDQLGKLDLPNIGNQLRRVALATPDGNLHELSIIIADILCRANRIPTFYLGPAHPAESLGEAVNALNIKTVVMGVVSSDKWNYAENMIPYLEQLDHKLKVKVNVILGGGWVLEFPKFKNILKVDIIESFESFDEKLEDFTLAV